MLRYGFMTKTTNLTLWIYENGISVILALQEWPISFFLRLRMRVFFGDEVKKMILLIFSINTFGQNGFVSVWLYLKKGANSFITNNQHQILTFLLPCLKQPQSLTPSLSSTKRTVRITWPAEDLFIVIWLPVMFFSVRAELLKLLTLDCYVARMVKYTKWTRWKNCQSNGQHRKRYFTADIPPKVTCRYLAWGLKSQVFSLLQLMKRFNFFSFSKINKYSINNYF